MGHTEGKGKLLALQTWFLETREFQEEEATPNDHHSLTGSFYPASPLGWFPFLDNTTCILLQGLSHGHSTSLQLPGTASILTHPAFMMHCCRVVIEHCNKWQKQPLLSELLREGVVSPDQHGAMCRQNLCLQDFHYDFDPVAGSSIISFFKLFLF